MSFAQRLPQIAQAIDARLNTLVDELSANGSPPRLMAAVRHAVVGGGKRFRPFLVAEGAGLFGLSLEDALDTAVAVECVHCYSLIHDDLPAMDNDQVRRGQPTVWAAFDDWTAILAGDGLQALAFELLANASLAEGPVAAARHEIVGQLVAGLARASGLCGMVGGQALDLEAEKLSQPQHPDENYIRRLQAMKTGALIAFAAEAGAILAGAEMSARNALRSYGENVGVAFQISDDLLDAEGSAEIVGKAVAKDGHSGKATLIGIRGLEQTRHDLEDAKQAAIGALDVFGARADVLREAAKFVASRDR